MYYSFEGKYKQPLNQSLGRKPQSSKNDLLADAQEKRRQRELGRLRTTSALKIQACYRGFTAQKRAFDEMRRDFQKNMAAMKKGAATVQLIESSFRLLNVFFSKAKDDAAVVEMCSLAMKHKAEFRRFLFSSSDKSQWHLKRWLTIVCGVLERLSPSTENISMPLRVLEVYLDPELYGGKVEKGEDKLGHLYQHLISNGYFKTMRTLCDDRIPDSIEMGTVAPTPLAASLLALILRPMMLFNTSNASCRLKVMHEFSLSFMYQTYSPQVYFYILPCLRDEPSISASDVINSLTQEATSPEVEGSATLLHSCMTFVEKHVDSISDETFSQYIKLVIRHFPQLVEDCESSDEVEEFEEMEWSTDEHTSLFSTEGMKADCMQLLNTPSHINRFIAFALTDSDSLLAIAQLCHVLTSKLQQRVHSCRLLSRLAFNTEFLRKLWRECQVISVVNSAGNMVSLMQVLSRGLGDSLYTSVQGSIHKLMSLLSTFSSLFYYFVLTLHDDDFKPRIAHLQESYTSSCPFKRAELVNMVALLREACLGVVYLAIPDSKPVFDSKRKFLEELGIKPATDKTLTKESYLRQRAQWIYLFTVMSRLTKHLYIRDTRTHFCPSNHWLSNQVKVQAHMLHAIYRHHVDVFDLKPLRADIDEEDEDSISLSVNDSRRLVILTELPFVVPFEERVQIFHKLLAADRENYQTGFDGFGPMEQAAINITVRRDYIYEDAFEKLSPENEPNLRHRVKVQLRNAPGLSEAGIDGGGIFREFLSELLKTGFDPHRGVFRLTASDDKLLYPNPEAPAVLENSEKHFFFLGRLLGKALYENMLVELPFAGFFLTKILGKTDSDFHQLASLDPTLYKNLLFVKNYPGDVKELGLYFCVDNEVLGVTSQVELKANGKNIEVNNNNRIEYVHLMADYKLNRQVRAQCKAFTQGLEDILKLEWLRMFNHHELHTLISGATSPIDIDDLRAHTLYSGSYSMDHSTIHMFWRVVQSFTPSQRSALLKFVTSCSRPPLLGFKNLYPQFCIHHGGKEDRLPTASTCMNFLKLPEYSDEDVMKAKLLYAIESGAGFELS